MSPLERRAASVGLTPPQIEVLSLIAEGLTEQEIARQRECGLHFVTKMLEAAYAVLGVAGPKDAVIALWHEGVFVADGTDWSEHEAAELDAMVRADRKPPRQRVQVSSEMAATCRAIMRYQLKSEKRGASAFVSDAIRPVYRSAQAFA